MPVQSQYKVSHNEVWSPIPFGPNDHIHINVSDDLETMHLVICGSTVDQLASWVARTKFPERFPDKRELSTTGHGSQWSVPVTDISVMLIHRLWPADRVIFTSERALQVFNYLVLTAEKQSIVMRKAAEYHAYVPMRDKIRHLACPTTQIAAAHILKSGDPLMLHQNVGLECCYRTEGFGLFMEQGTGKTPIVIKRIDLEAPILKAKSNRMYRALIVAPKNVRTNWAYEVERFSTVPGACTVLRGGQMKRIKKLMEALALKQVPDQQYTMVVVSYEGLVQSWDVISKIEWDLGVLDEAHYIKSPSTKRGKHALKLREMCSQRMALTGTPVCNSPMDLYMILEWLRKGGSGFKSFDAFRAFYGVYQMSGEGRGVRRLVSIQNLPFMHERLASMSFIVRKEEALPDLPEKVYDICDVEMSPEQEKMYEALQQQLFLEIENDMQDDSKVIKVDNILVKLLRLAQITSGFMSFDPTQSSGSGIEETHLDRRHIEFFDPNPKLEALMELLEDKTPEQKTIIWAHFRPDIAAIMKRFQEKGLDAVEFHGGTKDEARELAVHRFNHDPKCQYFVANPGAGGTGLNLLGYPPGQGDKYDTNCDHEIYYSQDWSMPKRAQSEDRAVRRGTRVKVRITDLCVPETVDEEIRARVVDKKRMALETQDLRDILHKVLRRKNGNG